jgi:chorismate mutase
LNRIDGAVLALFEERGEAGAEAGRAQADEKLAIELTGLIERLDRRETRDSSVDAWSGR